MRGRSRLITVVVALASTVSLAVAPVPRAAAAIAPCKEFSRWTDPANNTWMFQNCDGHVVVTRFGGPLGRCSNSYPAGTVVADIERFHADTCDYDGPL